MFTHAVYLGWYNTVEKYFQYFVFRTLLFMKAKGERDYSSSNIIFFQLLGLAA